MSKVAVKPIWIASLALLLAIGVTIKLALALTAFTPANQPIAYVAQVEMTSYNLKSGNEVLFRGQYDREFWSGTVLAYPVSSSGDIDASGSSGTWWPADAAKMLDRQDFNTGRLIGTLKDDGTRIPFRFTSLSGAQQGYLTSSAVLDYLRGARGREISGGGTLRQRASAMGDVVHSRPYYVADAANPTLFVGANDGMLHAINAAQGPNGGKERWAYVPSMLLPRMKALSVEPYLHDYYVDGQINVATIASGSRRILVGALGAGGKGLYALDITGSAGLTAATESEVAAKAVWEITPTTLNHASPATPNAYVNLGYTHGGVSVAKVAGVDAVIVGNGYNDGAGSYSGCTNGRPNYANCGGNYAAYLYVINAETGQLIRAIKAGADRSAASPNGLSTPVAIDTDGDGSVDRVYAGDLNGTMWKFDLTDGTATALLTTSPAQSITSTPGVAIHPEGGYMVNFGTGKMLSAVDMEDTATHYAYGIWDGAPAANTELLTQTLSARDVTSTALTQRVRRVTSNQPAWRNGPVRHKGWKVALLGAERVLGEGSFIESGRYYFNAYDPTARSALPAGPGLAGSNTLLQLNYLSGGSSGQPFLSLGGKARPGDDDRIRYEAADTIAPGSKVGDPIMTTDAIAVGRFIAAGAASQPVLVRLGQLNTVLFNHHADAHLPMPDIERGLKGQVESQGMQSGSRESGLRSRTGRISWRELVAP